MTEAPPELSELHASLDRAVRTWLAHRAPSELDAEDLAQETWLRLHRALPRLREPAAAEALVWRTARSVLVDRLRRRRPQLSLDEGPPLPDPDLPEPGETDATETVASWLPAFVQALPEPYRTAVRRVDLEGASQAELARELGLSLSGARSRVQRGRARVRDLLLACCEVRFEDGEVSHIDRCPPSCRT